MRMVQTRSRRSASTPAKGARNKTGQPEPRAGMGQGPGQPADSDPLEPPADQRDAVAGDVNAVVAMRSSRWFFRPSTFAPVSRRLRTRAALSFATRRLFS